MDFLIELIVQGLFEFVIEMVTSGGSSTDRRNDTSPKRWDPNGLFLLAFTALGVGLGFLWGWHVATTGQRTPPITIWVSLFGAALFTLLAVRDANRPLAYLIPERSRYRPWTWPARQLWRVAVLNVAGAIGVWWGFAAMLPPKLG